MGNNSIPNIVFMGVVVYVYVCCGSHKKKKFHLIGMSKSSRRKNRGYNNRHLVSIKEFRNMCFIMTVRDGKVPTNRIIKNENKRTSKLKMMERVMNGNLIK